MSLPTDYRITRQSDGSYAVEHSHFGFLADEFACRASAEDWAEEHAAERAEMAALELNEQRAAALADFIYALDRGDFDSGVHVGVGEDRVESSYITALRAVA